MHDLLTSPEVSSALLILFALDEVIQSWPSDELGPCPYTYQNHD